MTLIKLLLADDEPIILRGLKKLLPWEELGFEIVGEASDGRELRELIRDLSPQLVISDISMPEGNGIEVIQEMNGRGGQAKIVFISAFQEFGYAREAVQLGALDYLVKPISKSQLESVVRKAEALIREESEGWQKRERLHYYEAKDRAHTIEELTARLLDGDLKALTTLAELKSLFIDGRCTLFVIEAEDSFGKYAWQEKERSLAHFALGNVIRETVESQQTMRGLTLQKEDRFVVLMQHADVDTLANLIEELVGKIERYLKLHVACGVGRTVDSPEFAAVAYRSALKALDQTYFTGFGRVLLDEETCESKPSTPPFDSAERQARLIGSMIAQRKEDIHPLTEELFAQIGISAGIGKHAAISALYHLVLSVIREWEQLRGKTNSSDRSYALLLERLTACPSYAEACTVAEEALRSRMEAADDLALSRDHDTPARIRAYIDEHYAEAITLEKMAAEFYMNPYYFSSFFKKQIGQNFKTYVTDIRMTKALALLHNPDRMIYEIAEQVGYNNVRHFSDTFKKKYGQVPQDYRQSGRTLS
ncbi:response regulator transcription factor [Saccharibacillus sacchari]|uniref:response regulator transcription factor n=1 Tax=Saccharibacillus sacchari TaxID=456493 RepID=UPI0004BC7E32|nr:response regulator [Saccharibacillus sacchari]